MNFKGAGMQRLLALIVFLLNAVSMNAAAAGCAFSSSPPSASAAGAILRNPTSTTALISVPITITCAAAQTVEFQATNASFLSSTNSSLKVTYSAASSGITNSSSFSSPSASSFISLGTMSSASVSGNFIFQIVPFINLQPGTYNESITIRVGGVSGQTFSFLTSASIPTDCNITVGTVPDAATIGDILRNPGGRSILIPAVFSCNTYQSRVDVSAQNGYFKGVTPSNATRISYNVTLSSGALISTATVASSQIAGNTWVILGNLAGTNSSSNVVVTPTQVNNLMADTYNEVLTLRVNAP
jgi:hypothetical protein